MFRPEFHLANLPIGMQVTGGWALIALGILALPLPGPFTIPPIALGGVVLIRHSRSFRVGVSWVRARFPESSAEITRRSRQWPRALRYVVLRTDPRRRRSAASA